MTDAGTVALSTYLGVAPKSPEAGVLRLLIELAAQFVGAEEGSLLVYDKATEELVFAMTIGGEASERALVGQRVPVGKGITGLAAMTGEVQIGAPTFKDVRQSERRDASGPTAVLAAPMLVTGDLVGVITAVSFRADAAFTAGHADLYGRIAAVAGVVVEQRRRIDALEAIRGGGVPAGEGAARERRIVEAVTRLVGGDSERTEKVAALMEAIAAVAAPK